MNRLAGSVTEPLREVLERYPTAYLGLARTKRGRNRNVARRGHTDLTVEGFPRSGNTFLLAWILRANPHLTIASHVHSAAHVRYSVGAGIPTVVVVRAPTKCVASLLVMHPQIKPQVALRRYIRFSEAALEAATKILIAPFEVVSTNPGRLVEVVNDRFELELSTGGYGEIASAETFELVEELSRRRHGELRENFVPRPSAARSAASDGARELISGDEFSALVARAEFLYAELCSLDSGIALRAPEA